MRYFIYLRKSTDDTEHQVLSLESQEREVRARINGGSDFTIVETISESRSAKHPGRSLFNEMLDRIEKSEADGIVAWQPDRLARNAIDSGRIINMLDTGKLKDLKFCTYSFENTASGKYMLQIMLATAKYHVDHMSDNIRTGNLTKVLNGWRPNMAPIGYLNDRSTNTITSDPERFLLVKQLWEHLLTGAFTIPELRDLARDQWGLRRKSRQKAGGTALTISGLYWLFQNPFYAGILRHEGRDYPGKHEPMVSVEQFEMAQHILGRGRVARLSRHEWTYTGLIKCICGHGVTAERKVNRFGSVYVYYHCARQRAGDRCGEPYVREQVIADAFRESLARITLPTEFHAWALNIATRDIKELNDTVAKQRENMARAQLVNATSLKNLRHMRLRNQMSEAEYNEDRLELERERLKLSDQMERLNASTLIEPEKAFILFNVCALKWFDGGDRATKRMIIETALSNPTLNGKILKLDGRFPFQLKPQNLTIPHLCTVLDVIRTHPDRSAFERLVQTVHILASNDDQRLLNAA
jgi:site-specific DNA recombinase